MKKLILAALALSAGAWLETAEAQMYVVKDGEVKAAIDYTPDYITFENPMSCGGIVGTPVDMGLSVKWSNVNVGASRPEELGNEYAWGETETKNEYTWANYKHLQSGKDNWGYINKYQAPDKQYRAAWYDVDGNFIGDNKTTLDPQDDAAAANWGGDWATPTQEDWKELVQNTTNKWVANYQGSGIGGYLFNSKVEGHTDDCIFLPATGWHEGSGPEYEGTSSVGVRAYYWSATLNNNYTSSMFVFNGNSCGNSTKERYLGCQVRAVCPSTGSTNGHASVNLGLPSGKLWATCNVGTDVPTGIGYYVAWGETAQKQEYSWATYAFMREGGTTAKDINKYTKADGQSEGGIWYTDALEFTGDGKTTIESVDDVATTQWSSKWRIPTNAEWEELFKNTTQEWVDNYYCTGVSGWILTSTVEGHTSAYIFLPANYTTSGEYWSASLSTTALAKSFLFGKSSCSFTHDYRKSGLPIRPVCPAEE